MLYIATEALKKAINGIQYITVSNGILNPRGGGKGNNAAFTTDITNTLMPGPNIMDRPNSQTLFVNLVPDLVILYVKSKPKIIAVIAIKLYTGPDCISPGNITNKLIKFMTATPKLTLAPYKKNATIIGISQSSYIRKGAKGAGIFKGER